MFLDVSYIPEIRLGLEPGKMLFSQGGNLNLSLLGVRLNKQTNKYSDLSLLLMLFSDLSYRHRRTHRRTDSNQHS